MTKLQSCLGAILFLLLVVHSETKSSGSTISSTRTDWKRYRNLKDQSKILASQSLETWTDSCFQVSHGCWELQTLDSPPHALTFLECFPVGDLPNDDNKCESKERENLPLALSQCGIKQGLLQSM